MKNKIFLLFSFIASSMLTAQVCSPNDSPFNLVQNGDFENFSQLPNSISQIDRAIGWSSLTGTADYFHRLSDHMSIPNNFATGLNPGDVGIDDNQGGNAYAGVIGSNSPGGTNEIIKTQLTSPLEANTEYILEFDVIDTSALITFSGSMRFEAYLGGDIQTTTTNALPIDEDGDGVPDGNGILLQQDGFTTNSQDWQTISLQFNSGDQGEQNFLYLGTLFNPQTINGPLAYALIDNVNLAPATCNGDNLPCAHGFVTLDPNQFSCSDENILITGTYENPGNLNGSFADQPNITLEIIYNDIPMSTLDNPAFNQTNDLGGNYSFAIDNSNLDQTGTGDYTFRVKATWELNNSCNPNTGTMEVNESDQSNNSGPTINGDVFCCNDNTGFSIENFCPPYAPIDCDSPICPAEECNSPSCEHPDGITGFRVVDSGGNIVNNDSYPGIVFSWSNNQTGELGENFSFNAPFNVNVSVIMSFNGCESETLSDILTCGEPPACEDCEDVGDLIINSITEGDTCGSYRLEIPEDVFDCYNVYFTADLDNTPITQITLNDINNENYHFSYVENGSYGPFLVLLNIEDGKTCYKNQGDKIIVDCEEPPTCEDCQEVANNIIVTDTGINCEGVGEYFVPFGTNECYSVFLVFAHSHSIILELFDGANFYTYNSRHAILIIDNSTGLVCSIVTDFPPGIGCDDTKLSFHPNPFSSEFYFQDTLDRSISKVEIYNAFGSLIKSQPYQDGNPIRIDEGSSGLYFAKIYFEDGTIETVQLIKK